MSNNFHFFTKWRIEGTVAEVTDVLQDATELPRWWPSVYLGVKRLQDGDENRVGEVIDLYTKGYLPYTLRWHFRIVEVEPQKRLKLESHGDFVGFGTWTFTQDGPWVDVGYDWDIRADKPLLRRLTFIMRPIFAWNHRWAMEQGEKSLKLELARRRAATAEERALIPAPPPATPTSFWFLFVAPFRWMMDSRRKA